MTKRKVVKDRSGAIINIGEWELAEEETLTGLLDASGKPIVRKVAMNPLPEGAYTAVVDIVEGWDGGLYASDDPRRLGNKI